MDAGIATDENIKLLLKKDYEYICVSRSSHKDLIKNVKEEELVKFKNKSDKELSAKLFKQELEYDDKNNQKCVINESIIYLSIFNMNINSSNTSHISIPKNIMVSINRYSSYRRSIYNIP